MQRATAQAKRGSLDAASGGSGGAGKYAAAAHKLLDEVTDMLDEAEQDQIIKVIHTSSY